MLYKADILSNNAMFNCIEYDQNAMKIIEFYNAIRYILPESNINIAVNQLNTNLGITCIDFTAKWNHKFFTVPREMNAVT